MNKKISESALFFVFSFFALLLPHFVPAQQQGYHIQVSISGLQDTSIQLAYHFGDKQYIKTSITLDAEGKGIFSDTATLPGGMYMIVMPDRKYFEIMLDDDQEFSVSTQYPELNENLQVSGSEVNSIMVDYVTFLMSKRKEHASLKELKNATEDADSIENIKGQMDSIDAAVRAYQVAMRQQHPSSLFVKFLKALDEPTIPAPPVDSLGNIDSTFEFRYYKSHLLDGIDYTDERLLRTPAYHKQINTYLQQLTYQHPDSLIESADYLIAKASANKELYKYTLAWLLNKYADSKVMGMDAVYVHLAENYYMKGKAEWIDSVQLQKIMNSALKLNPFLLGKKVPDINMQDQFGKWHRLYDISSEYTVLYFWDADCGHCRKETPKMGKVYNLVKDKDVTFYAVSIELTTDHWLKFIEEHKLEWINLIDTANTSGFRSHYKIESTPVLYVLNKEKEIVAKRLDAKNLYEWFDHYIGPLPPFDDKATERKEPEEGQ